MNYRTLLQLAVTLVAAPALMFIVVSSVTAQESNAVDPPGKSSAESSEPTTVKQQNDRLVARIVLFVDEGQGVPEGYDIRLASLAQKTESFFGKWSKHWGREIGNTTIFARGEGENNGRIQVTLVKGTLKGSAGRESLPEIRKKSIDGATSQLGLKKDAPVVWWIFYHYEGVRGFRGGGEITGGVAINRYPPGVGPIDQEMELAAPALADANIKGAMHEFGHALGLPHTGPRPDLELGNSLMGPINRAFAGKSGSKDKRVYLTESSAAMLWKHPIFQMRRPATPRMAKKVETVDFTAEEHDEGQKIIIKGRLQSDRSAHSVVIFNSSRGQFGRDYWARSWVGEIDEHGKFEIAIVNPFDEGKMFLSYCFDDGFNTADGKRQLLRGSVLEIPCGGKPGSRKFQSPSIIERN